MGGDCQTDQDCRGPRVCRAGQCRSGELTTAGRRGAVAGSQKNNNLPPTLRALAGAGETGTDDSDVYSYSAGFEARKRGHKQTEKSTRHKIEAQFSGTTSSASSSSSSSPSSSSSSSSTLA